MSQRRCCVSSQLTEVLPLALQLHGFIAAQPCGSAHLIDRRSEAAANACSRHCSQVQLEAGAS